MPTMSIRSFKEGLSPERLELLLEKTPFTRFLAPKVERCDNGFAQLRVLLRRDLTQHHGFAHGAVVGCVADSACAWAAGSIAGDVVTSEYKVHFLEPAVGEALVGKGRVLKQSKAIVAAQSDVFVVRRDKEILVATALATLAVVQ